MSAAPDFSALAGYASKEKWGLAFANAGAALARAREVYDKGLKVTLKQNKPEGEAQARAQIKQVASVIREAKDQARAPFERASRITAAMTEAPAMEKSALAAAEAILAKVRTLEQGPVAGAREKFPASDAKITARFAPFAKMADDTKTIGILSRPSIRRMPKEMPTMLLLLRPPMPLEGQRRRFPRTGQNSKKIWTSYTAAIPKSFERHEGGILCLYLS